MRLVLVHGINQQGKSEDIIKQEWLGALDAGVGRAASARLEAVAPFYGDALRDAAGPRFDGVVAQGEGEAADASDFVIAALQEQASATKASRQDIRAAEREFAPAGAVVDQNLVMNRRLNALLRVIERFSPMHGSVVMGFLKQADVYLKRPGVKDIIDGIVRPTLDSGPAIVIGHSLGTVVTFKLLRQMALEGRPMEVPLYVTLGSPLPLMAVQAALGPAFLVPKAVKRWINVYNADDLIALGQGLDRSNFSDGIENLTDIRTVDDDPHAIKGYIGDRRVGEAILAACGI